MGFRFPCMLWNKMGGPHTSSLLHGCDVKNRHISLVLVHSNQYGATTVVSLYYVIMLSLVRTTGG